MALSAVMSTLMEKLGDIALRKASELYGVSSRVELIQVELNLIRGFLKDADSKRKRSSLIKQWVNELRDVAYRIEDVMDTFLIEIERKKPEAQGQGMIGIFTRVRKIPVKVNVLSDEIERIREVLKTLYKRGKQLEIGQTISSTSGIDDNIIGLPFRPTKPFEIDDSEVVGLDSDKRHIISQLLDQSISRRTVLSIVGVGGIGKTTLAQKVYKSAELEGQFQYCTWLSISQKFDINNLWRKILYSIKPSMKEKNPCDDDLPEELVRSLSGKRYLIILDDVWTVELWERLKLALPASQNASRVLITTRILDVAKAADNGTQPYELRSLNETDSLALIFRKAFQANIQPQNYPAHLIDVAKQLTHKCGGLPLALVVLGGIISTKDHRHYSAWHTVGNTFDWHKQGERCLRILAMSYEDLPYELKPCFLYFAAFPEDHNIVAKQVTRMWISEGLIPKHGVGTLEDRAEDYFEQLVQRSLVDVTQKTKNGYCKYCRIHDLIRDLAIHEAKEDNFFTIFSKEGDVNQQLGPSPSTVMRRLSLQFCTPTDYTGEYDVHSTNIRTLLCFRESVSNYEGFQLLKVLAIESVDMRGKDVAFKKWLEGLVHLRYLGFRFCENMPEGFEKFAFSSLKNLETLDCRETEVGGNPSLWEIPTLRHVISGIYSKVAVPLNWHQLKHLQTLKWASLKNSIPELKCNVNLRTLKISNGLGYNASAEEGWNRLKALLSRTQHLVSLSIVQFTGDIPFLSVGTGGLPCHETIQSLRLTGNWACILTAEMFPKYLTKLRLEESNLEEDPMPVLERLQSLRILHLLVRSYLETTMICSTAGFPSLQMLKLKSLNQLSKWEIKEGAMPILSELQIIRCYELNTLPDLQNVPSLQDLLVMDTSPILYARSQEEDLHKIKNIRSVRIEAKSNNKETQGKKQKHNKDLIGLLLNS